MANGNGNGDRWKTVAAWGTLAAMIAGGGFTLGHQAGLGEGAENTIAERVSAVSNRVKRTRERLDGLAEDVDRLRDKVQRLQWQTDDDGRPDR